MPFRIVKGKTVRRQFDVTTSTEFAANSLVAFSTSGKLIPANSASAKEAVVGILDKAILSTDANYATAREVGVLVPLEKNVIVEADVTAGLVAADIGAYQDLTDASTVNRSGSTNDIVKCVKVLSGTKGRFTLNIGGAGE